MFLKILKIQLIKKMANNLKVADERCLIFNEEEGILVMMSHMTKKKKKVLQTKTTCSI